MLLSKLPQVVKHVLYIYTANIAFFLVGTAEAYNMHFACTFAFYGTPDLGVSLIALFHLFII